MDFTSNGWILVVFVTLCELNIAIFHFSYYYEARMDISHIVLKVMFLLPFFFFREKCYEIPFNKRFNQCSCLVPKIHRAVLFFFWFEVIPRVTLKTTKETKDNNGKREAIKSWTLF